MLTATTPNDSELEDIEFRNAELAARFPEPECCATCGRPLPLCYRVSPDEAYCASCSRYPRLYATTIAIVNSALTARCNSRNVIQVRERADTRAHERATVSCRDDAARANNADALIANDLTRAS